MCGVGGRGYKLRWYSVVKTEVRGYSGVQIVWGTLGHKLWGYTGVQTLGVRWGKIVGVQWVQIVGVQWVQIVGVQ